MPTETLTSDAYIWPKDTSQTMVCDGRITDQIVDDFGVNVKLRVVNKPSFNRYGDATKTYTDTFTKAYIHTWQITDDEVKEGIYANGEIAFIFKLADDSKIKTGNYIFFENEWYRITRINYQRLGSVKYLISASVETAQVTW